MMVFMQAATLLHRHGMAWHGVAHRPQTQQQQHTTQVSDQPALQVTINTNRYLWKAETAHNNVQE